MGNDLIEEEEEESYDNPMLRSDIIEDDQQEFQVADSANPTMFDPDHEKRNETGKMPGNNRPFSAIHIPNKNLVVPEGILFET